MSNISGPLPEFENPPVIEVALSVQFEPIKPLHTPQFGSLWNEMKDRFPVTEEHPPLDPVFERFGIPSRRPRGTVQLQMLEAPPVPRCWFLNKTGAELIQVQPDRFIHNWRKRGDQEKYPRYDRLRETFDEELRRFQAFLQHENLGTLCPNQCEVTYVNHIIAGEGWQHHGELNRVTAPVSLHFSDSFLKSPEDVQIAIRFVIRDDSGQPIGRLHVVVEPAYRASDDHPMYVMTLTARGEPVGEGIQGALRFLDIGREWVVRGFASVTTTEMHEIWRRRDVR